jgi:hypothetical protein
MRTASVIFKNATTRTLNDAGRLHVCCDGWLCVRKQEGTDTKMAVIIKRKRDVEPLHVEGKLPTAWTGPLVAACLVEAFAASAKLPRGIYTGLRKSCLPIVHDADDLAGQKEQREVELADGMPSRLRIVLSSDEVSRCDAALYWPAKYLSAEPQLAEAVNRVALARAHDRDIAWVASRYGGCVDTWRQRHDVGCLLIARGLVADRVSVF